MNRFFTIAFVLISAAAFCQSGGVGINANGAPPAASAILDLSSTSKGFVMPRVTQTQRDAIQSPVLGLQIFNTTNNCFEAYGFSNWQTLSCLCNGAPSTPSTITGNSNPCANAPSVTYTVGLVLGANTYTWTVPSGAVIIAGQGTNSITVNYGVNPGNVTVSANNSCGSSSASTLPVTINSIPSTPGTITGNPYPCANSNAQAYSTSSVDGATSYTWTVPSGSIVTAGQGTTSMLVNFSTTPGNLAVTANNTCGSSSASVLPISMAITPSTPGSIIGADTFALNQFGAHYTVAPVTEATTYTWTVPYDATITAGQGTDSITVNFGGHNGTICVTASNCAGTSSSSCKTVNSSCYTGGTQTYNYTGGTQNFTVPACIYVLTIEAFGAAGGTHSGGEVGGNGADIKGTFDVTPGQVINIIAGGMGQDNPNGNIANGGAGGGGGSFAYTAGPNLLIAAGGGGGGALYDDGYPKDVGDNGQTTTCASASKSCWAGGCAGADGSGNFAGKGWNSIQSNANGIGYGGYGGGGTADYHGGGGGGGYSGGGGSGSSNGCGGYGDGGGGGGSYNGGTNQTNTGGVQTGSGQVVLTW